MSYQPKDNTGTIFKNTRREKDTQPNARGTAMIDGVMFEIAAWTKKDKNGDPFQSLSFKKADETARREHVETTRRGSLKDQLDDDICF